MLNKAGEGISELYHVGKILPGIDGFKREGGKESKNVGNLQKLEKARKWIFPPRKKTALLPS